MTEIQQAFAHPLERARATVPDPRDRISLRDHVVEVEIGAFQQERGVTQRLQFNIVVEVATHAADAADDVDKILSYDRLTDAIAAELSNERLNLLETLADRVAERILAEPQALRAFVRIEKLDRGPGALGVEIVRARDGKATAPDAQIRALIPRIVMLSPDAIASGRIGTWLDHAGDGPWILCTATPDHAAPQAAHPMAQRRIALLALEQAAWVLAGQDKRCVVVDSRTELEWAMDHDRISVWAPAKMILDAPDGPDGRDDAARLAWIQAQMQAQDVIQITATSPDEVMA